jgi:ATP phosphoribosyltransferase
MITIAVARGRLLEEAGELFIKAGYKVDSILKDSRKLIFEYPDINLKFLIIRPTDIPAYVEYGAADCGIVGKDTLLEEKNNLYEPLDLKIGQCKLVVAGPKGFDFTSNRSLRVATKYPKTTYDHFKLYGSVELAPLVGLSDVIVDLSASGETLKKNNLVEYETIADITARLVVNRVSMKVKAKEIKELIERLRKVREKS